MPRKILVTGGSAGPLHFIEHPADDEYELQSILLGHPELIPAADLGLDDDLLVVGRETTMASGSIDLLLLSRSGEIVIVEFKTGPQNPDFRAALAQVIDYGSDLWKLGGWGAFDDGVVRRYLTGRYVLPPFRAASSLHEAAAIAWSLDDDAWAIFVTRLDQVIATGAFHFVIAAQRFTDQMKVTAQYLNETRLHGKFFLVELVRLDSTNQKAFAAQVVERPSLRGRVQGSTSTANEQDFLAAIGDDAYRESLTELFATASALGLVNTWYSKGASIRMKSPDRTEPISVGWVLPDGGQWQGARHVTFGVDPATLKNHPTVTAAVTAFCEKLLQVPGGRPATSKLNAVIFEPAAFPPASSRLFELLSELTGAAADSSRVGRARLEEGSA